MDDVTPKPNNPQQNVTAPPVPDAPEPVSTSAPDSNMVTPTPEMAAPSSEVSAEPMAEAPVPENAPAETAPPSDQVVTSAPVANDAMKKKSAMPLVMIIVILVVVGLASAAYLAFVKTDEKAAAPAVQSAQPQTSSTDAAAINDSIDSSLNAVNDQKDYSSTDLNDATLGL